MHWPRRRLSDNIPGVPGIGIKTAATARHIDSMAELLERADEVKGKRGENLRSFKEQALLSYELATIKLDVPVELDEAALQSSEPDPNELADFCRELNFKRFLKEFDLEDHAVAKVSSTDRRTKPYSPSIRSRRRSDKSRTPVYCPSISRLRV